MCAVELEAGNVRVVSDVAGDEGEAVLDCCGGDEDIHSALVDLALLTTEFKPNRCGLGRDSQANHEDSGVAQEDPESAVRFG